MFAPLWERGASLLQVVRVDSSAAPADRFVRLGRMALRGIAGGTRLTLAAHSLPASTSMPEPSWEEWFRRSLGGGSPSKRPRAGRRRALGEEDREDWPGRQATGSGPPMRGRGAGEQLRAEIAIAARDRTDDIGLGEQLRESPRREFLQDHSTDSTASPRASTCRDRSQARRTDSAASGGSSASRAWACRRRPVAWSWSSCSCKPTFCSGWNLTLERLVLGKGLSLP